MTPFLLRTYYQQALQKSLLVYLKKIEDSFSLPLPHLVAKVTSLDAERRFSPALFSIYVHLKEAYERKDVQATFSFLQHLKQGEKWYSSVRSCSTILTESWEKECLAYVTASLPAEERGEVRMLPLVHWKEEQFPPPALLEAEKWIQEKVPAIWEEYEAYVSSIKLFSGRVVEGVTSPRFFGNIYLRLPYPHEDPCLFYFEQLIHEVSHLHLYTLMREDPLVVNAPEALFSSPLRQDKRPMRGIFHAAFVLHRIKEAFHALKHASHESERVLLKAEKSLQACLATLKVEGKFTSLGEEIFQQLVVDSRIST